MVIIREDRMLIKVLQREKGSRKLLAEFPNRAFELIPTVFIVLETCVFSVRDAKSHNTAYTQETQFIEILHTVPK